MPEQLSLPGMSTPAKPRPETRDRLFLAVLPDAAAAAQIVGLRETLCARHGLTGSQIAQDRLHVTLHHLGDFRGVPEHVVRAASMAAAATAATAPRFEARLDQVESFSGKPGHRPFVLRDSGGNDALQELHRRVITALGKNGNAKFVPHVTLLYDEKGVGREPVDAISWTVKEIVLVHSLLGKTRYITLGRWALQH
jgi:RNA 2',3'-cyclic 3'-phosphodiesterase